MVKQDYDYISTFGMLVGKSHLPKNIPCQDYSLCEQINGVNVACLSDGCGSEENSQYGSEITVKSMIELLTTRFDELFNHNFRNADEQIFVRKEIVEYIIEKQKEFIRNNAEIFTKNISLNSASKHNIENDEKFMNLSLKSLCSTILFFAEKDDKYLIGRIGDGTLGVLIDDKLKIALEEKKSDEVNGTFYPFNLYVLAKENTQNYLANCFELKRLEKRNISGAILSSDGCNGLFCHKKDLFHKRYVPGVEDLFNNLIKLKDIEKRNKYLLDNCLKDLVNKSNSLDDCSLAILIKPDFVINEFVIKEYPRPVISQQPISEEKSEQNQYLPLKIKLLLEKFKINEDFFKFIHHSFIEFMNEFDDLCKNWISEEDNGLDEDKIMKFLKISYIEKLNIDALLECDVFYYNQLYSEDVIKPGKFDSKIEDIVFNEDVDIKEGFFR